MKVANNCHPFMACALLYCVIEPGQQLLCTFIYFPSF